MAIFSDFRRGKGFWAQSPSLFLEMVLTLTYPLSIFGYFVMGVLGALAFLFVLLLFGDKSLEILQNRIVKSMRTMGAVYVILGGVLAAVANLPANPDFGPNQFPLAFAAGLGWPAIVAGLSGGSKVAEITNRRAEEIAEKASTAEELKEEAIARVQQYFGNRLEAVRDSSNKIIQTLEAELDRVRAYYENRLVGGVGRP